MSEEKNLDKQNKKEMVELNERLSNLVFTLQKEVKNLKEDTLINAQHLSMFKKMSAKSINNLNKEVETHLQATGDFIGNLESENEK
ncbi:hypothetical protein EU792_09190, partial [Campylobacter upsaliensis]|nr:hypothetical protein [Campylobacter upsaliensis]